MLVFVGESSSSTFGFTVQFNKNGQASTPTWAKKTNYTYSYQYNDSQASNSSNVIVQNVTIVNKV